MIKFGTAGIPLSCEGDTSDGIKKCAELGLHAMELEFVKSVYLKGDEPANVGKVANNHNIKLSAHAPFFMNCCSLEPRKRGNSIGYLISSAKALSLAINESSQDKGVIVFHPGFYMKRDKKVCMDDVLRTMESVYKRIDDNIVLGPELMGKKTQFGSLDEIIQLSEFFGLEKCQPVIDWGHLNSRNNGLLKSEADYIKVFDKVENRLGSKSLKSFHAHFSEQEYSDKGERKHIPMGTGEPDFKHLAKVCKENGYKGTFICESPLLEGDALKMIDIWQKL